MTETDGSIEELIARVWRRGFLDGWNRPDRMDVPADLLALAEHYDQMAALRTARRTTRATVGRHVHHIDGDVLNNDLDNLMLVDPESNAGRGTQ